MSQIGIDCGQTLIKCVWTNAAGERQHETFPYARFASEMATIPFLEKRIDNGVTTVRIVGLGWLGIPTSQLQSRFSGLEFIRAAPLDRIADEKRVQARGVRELVKEQNLGVDDFLVVSVGSGTSYTLVNGDHLEPMSMGNPIGGGYILGHAGFNRLSLEYFETNSQGIPLDSRMFEAIPELVNSPEGQYVLAHFAKCDANSRPQDYAATLMHHVAVAVIRDIMNLEKQGGYQFKNIVFVGTPVNRFPMLRGFLETYAQFLGKTSFVPSNGQYAGALGAMLDHN